MSRLTVAGSLLLLAAVSLAIAGDRQPVYRTPQEVFQASLKAYQRDDYKALCTMLTDAARDQLAGQVAFGSLLNRNRLRASIESAPADKRKEIAAKVKSLDDVLSKHGLTEEALNKMKKKPADPKDPDPAKQMLQQLTAPIKDRCAFIVAMAPVLKKLSPDQGKGGPVPPDSRLKDIKIDGDRAKGVIVYKDGGEEQREPVAFRKRMGSWKIDLPPASGKERTKETPSRK